MNNNKMFQFSIWYFSATFVELLNYNIAMATKIIINWKILVLDS